MKLQHFRDLVAIAEHGSLRAAARYLGTAQPTLTRSLSELERELGAPLFERRSKGMFATPLGQAFVRRAIAILNDVRRAKDEFEQLRGNAVGSVAVGLSIAAHLRLLPKTLKQFRRSFPKVRLRIIEGFYPMLESGTPGWECRLLYRTRPRPQSAANAAQGAPPFRTPIGSLPGRSSTCKCDVTQSARECGMDHHIYNAEGRKRDRRPL